HGLVDQGNEYHEFMNRARNSGYFRPGIFHASITGVGRVAAYFGMIKIAELTHSEISTGSFDVLRRGPVYENRLLGFGELVNVALNSPGPPRRVRHWWRQDPIHLAIDTLSRLLLRVQNYRHGGTVLISPQ